MYYDYKWNKLQDYSGKLEFYRQNSKLEKTFWIQAKSFVDYIFKLFITVLKKSFVTKKLNNAIKGVKSRFISEIWNCYFEV